MSSGDRAPEFQQMLWYRRRSIDDEVAILVNLDFSSSLQIDRGMKDDCRLL